MNAYALSRRQTSKGVWYWVVSFRRRGRLHQRFFYDTGHGGSSKAHKAARAWRDEQLVKLSTFGKREFCEQQRSNNTSGVPGVHFLTSAKQPEGFWQARLKLAGKPAVHKSFSVRKHSYKAAYEMAVAARQKMLDQVDDKPYLYAAVAKRKAMAAGTPGR